MVTEEEVEELIEHCPTLYHMAERGLLSTSALLDLYDVAEPERTKI